MSELPENNYVSIIVCHYSKVDDFGGHRARRQKETRSEMLRTTMASLEKNTDYPAEIIVIDNGGDLDDSEYLLELVRKGVINTYIRNKNNMYYGWAWNQGKRLATGKYICFTCNDIEFKSNWLSVTIKPLLDYPEKKLLATPFILPDKAVPKFDMGRLDGYRLNSSAGSNCLIMTTENADYFGELNTSPTAMYRWYHKMWEEGWLIIAPAENIADHLAHRGGVDFMQVIKVKKELLNKNIIDYSTSKWQE